MFTSVSNRSAAAYRRVDVETSVDGADPHRLIDLLFEALQRSLVASRGAMHCGDFAGKIKHIDNAIRILDEGLKSALNLKAGGDLAKNLDGLYDYSIERLVLANVKNDSALIDEVIELMSQISSGWRQIKQQGLPN